MPDAHAFVVEADAESVRLDLFLARRLPDLSRARIRVLIDDGAVLVDGRPAKPSLRLRAGSAVRSSVPDPAPAQPRPEDIPLARRARGRRSS